MKGQMAHTYDDAFLCIDMHTCICVVCMCAFWYIEHIIEAIKWDEFVMFHVSRATHPLFSFILYWVQCSTVAANVELFITWTSVMVVQNQGTQEFWLQPPRIQAVTYSTHKRHSESLNAETRTHIKQIFPFIPRISVGCSSKAQGGRCCQTFSRAAHRFVLCIWF